MEGAAVKQRILQVETSRKVINNKLKGLTINELGCLLNDLYLASLEEDQLTREYLDEVMGLIRERMIIKAAAKKTELNNEGYI